MKNIDLNLLRIFNELIRTGKVVDAAEHLGMSYLSEQKVG